MYSSTTSCRAVPASTWRLRMADLTLVMRLGSRRSMRWARKIAAFSSPTCWLTRLTMASSSAAAALQAASKRWTSSERTAASRYCGSRRAKT